MVFTIDSLCKKYNGKPVISGISFSVDKGDIVSLIGPSGVGKTTLLRILAGLEEQDSGLITFETPPSKDNPVIMVFQDYLLFPSLTVSENTAFALKARKLPAAEITRRVNTILEFFHLSDKSNQYPAQLSAGQKQRVAIARAMVVNPAVLLLDEPFANLDRNLKLETAEFIRDTQKEFGITTVSVTHDLEEAFAMSDKIGIMLNGKLEQFDNPSALYNSPKSIEVARFLGPVNILTPELCNNLSLPASTIPKGRDYFIVRPEQLTLTQGSTALITRVQFGGHYVKYSLQVEDTKLTAYSFTAIFTEGDTVGIQISQL
ncbi:ABC transporter ATP-binding protein [Halodesulfovibrio marinisediminis]|uniref:Putative spermidine/putrescine transport system ATP-binding protein n=1 Tax=Halodesulfovibrio marinisediminis DSM 17456 TaxID=1121457 RepID=A0A1N6J255_9BACT|nr:ABC transporter ATP-binding protein [Halodesulfovibrio marinisediminis]SIO38342.1 putative spermidine/putrescine transport system ATP-binding protein [Halodesulfovibrio marinisediminis DSM 17456]